MTTTEPTGESPDALAQRLFEACVGALDLLHVYVGDQLGLYNALAETPATVTGLAERAHIAPRYAREWLEHQAAAGILTVTQDDGDPDRREYVLPAGHREVLCDELSLSYMAPLPAGVVSLAQTLPQVLDAFATGNGVAFDAYGPDIRRFIARINRPMFTHLLATDWFPKVPGLVDRLRAQPPAKVADIGCGSGWSTIAIALGFPDVHVVGVDLDEASITEARGHAAEAGVANRVQFVTGDATKPPLSGDFDLVCAFETIHDMCDPVAALAAMRKLRAEKGTVLIADERVADTFTTEPDPIERFQYGWSALHCLPTALTTPPAAGTGTLIRTPKMRQYAIAAGYNDLEVLPIDNDFWRFYRLLD